MAGTRYLRFVIIAVIALAVVFFISSSPTSQEQLRGVANTVANKINEQLSFNPKTGDAPTGSKSIAQDITEDPLSDTRVEAPTSSNPKTSHPKPKVKADRVNATFVSLARNGDLWDLVASIQQVEDRFNHAYGYDWVFLNDQPFSDEFKKVTTNLISGTTKYGLIGEEHWSFPEWIDQQKAADVREDMKNREIIYGDSISYRHMCRFESGFFFRQPLMLEYEWYWRVEPSIKLFCDIPYDPFKYMADHGKKYSFVLSLHEYKETIPTLWDSTKTYMKEHPEHIAEDNMMSWLSDDQGDSYNGCHFWSNFEVGSLEWLRSDAYTDYFKRLDEDGGFFYERWGDAPIHSIAAALTLPKEQIHFFNDIAYYHVPFTHCPTEESIRVDRKCSCKPEDNFDWNDYACMSRRAS
ncbi:hypothetical protein FH972_022296 [Carpinus fangiana]|uniref:Uncharacterized protein n=1 Tax=Carpinus fangiana TaxID=176857 RepID=A0A5N6KSG8_9ROSI|nr:hypothetical protein FH972_022296 [Carpinus fangiana]